MTGYNDIRAEAMASHNKRQTMYRADGGAVHDDAAADKKLIDKEIKSKVKPADLKRASGGEVEGRARGGKADRPGKHGNKTVVNVISAPPQGGAPPMMHPPVAGLGPAPGGPPPGAMPPPGGMPPPGAMPPHPPMAGPGPGGPPPPGPMPMRARGGSMTGGAATGQGRLDKAAAQKKGMMIERA